MRVTAMMHLAIHDKYGPVTLAEISQCQGISLSHLEQLFAKLRKRSLVEGVRGPGGGYRLASSPDQVTVADIISAVDERLDTTRCFGHENCQEVRRCLTHELWTDLSRQIFTFWKASPWRSSSNVRRSAKWCAAKTARADAIAPANECRLRP